MLVYILDLTCLFIYFRLFLGYSFRKNPWILTAGTFVILCEILLRLFYKDNMSIELAQILVITSILLPVLFINSKIGITIGWSMLFTLTMNLSYDILYGAMIIHNYEISHDGLTDSLSVILHCAVILLLVIITYILKSHNISISYSTKGIRFWWFVPFISGMILLRHNSYFSGAVDDYTAQTMHAMDMVRSGLLGAFVAVLFFMMLIILKQKSDLHQMISFNEKCISEQTKQYQRIWTQDAELRKFRHDYNRHIYAMQALLKSEHYDKLKDYVKDLAAFADNLQLINTNNIICDAILNQYNGLCEDSGITMTVTGKFPDNIAVRETDLCVIMSNAIENAFEATEKSSDNLKISVDILNQANLIIIKIKNSSSYENLSLEGDVPTSKGDSQSHGYGIKIMKEAVNRCGGNINWNINENNEVITEIILPLEI